MINIILPEIPHSEVNIINDIYDSANLPSENVKKTNNLEDKIFKSLNIKMDDYLNKIANDMFKMSNTRKKVKKLINHEIPTMKTCDIMLDYNYNNETLKTFAKHYKLKVSGNKSTLYKRIYIYLKLSSKIICIQKIFRGYLQRKCNLLRGPTFQLKLRGKNTNDCDFLTGDDIAEIPYNQYFSFTDLDDFIYGFDMLSFYNLISTSLHDKKNPLNPYNRLAIPENIIANMRQLIKISTALKSPITTKIQTIDYTENIEMRINNLFQTIDSLGNYSQSVWFLSLTKNKLIKFINELRDIWIFRAQLTPEIKILICPNGDPFRHLNTNYGNMINKSVCELKQIIIEVMEKFVNTNTDREYQSLGALYILGALTLVNDDAADAMFWLYQSFYTG
jgi:hypothetical protein